MKKTISRFLLSTMFISGVFAAPAVYAQCAGPVSIEGGIDYDSTNDQLLVCDGTNWIVVGPGGSGDNLGNHTATTNIQLGTNWLSNDGDSEGLRVSASSGAVLIQNAADSDEELHIGPEPGGSSDTAISMENNGHTFELHVEDGNRFRITNADETANWLNINGANGYIGMGTTPSERLHIVNAADVQNELRIHSTSAGTSAFTQVQSRNDAF